MSRDSERDSYYVGFITFIHRILVGLGFIVFKGLPRNLNDHRVVPKRHLLDGVRSQERDAGTYNISSANDVLVVPGVPGNTQGKTE